MSMTIQVHLKSEDELFNRFDPSRTRMSGDVYGYIKNCFEEIPLPERGSATIQIEGETPIDTSKVTTLLHAAVGRDLAAMDLKLKVNRLKMWRLYIIGIALIVVGIVLALSLNQLLLEVISIVGSMAVKDAAIIQIQHDPDIRVNKRLLEQLKTLPIKA